MQLAIRVLHRFQDVLDFSEAETPHFADDNGVGRHGIAGLGLGVTFGFHLCMLVLANAASMSMPVVQWCLFVCLMCCFHTGEWYITAAYRPNELAYKSWIINHSVAYTGSMIACSVEFWLEYLFFPSLKGNALWMIFCCMWCISSMSIRVIGMIHAGKNFDHIVMTRKKDDHELVTNGIYAYLRHPAYFGWFYWAIGAQMLLANPLCTVAFAYVSQNFFAQRVPPEEAALVKIYGEQYMEYAKRTRIGIPLVKGFVPFER